MRQDEQLHTEGVIMMAILTTELDGVNQSARLRISGYTLYVHVRPVAAGFEVQLDDHLTGDQKTLTSASTLQGGVELAKTALLNAAEQDGIDTAGLTEVAD